LFVHHHT